ncbi:hypothetical protein LEP1GSC132_4476 [Leptospira kirschneri str. 200803703]|nr:hypothetical protein LEP1GSC132_4476 [Leptospira kirschneri str. 200803703]
MTGILSATQGNNLVISTIHENVDQAKESIIEIFERISRSKHLRH